MSVVLQKILQWWDSADLRKRWMVLILIGSVICTGVFFAITGSTFSDGSRTTSGIKDIDTPIFYIGTVLKTIGVLLLIVGGGVILKRMQTNRPGRFSDRKMAVLETTRLSPRQALHLVQVGNQYFLVGATDQNLNLISAIHLGGTSENQDGEATKPNDDFKQMLNSAIIPPMNTTSTGIGLH